MTDASDHPVLDLPKVYLVRMMVFTLVVGVLAAILFPHMQRAFMANPGLNAVIIGALLIGYYEGARLVFSGRVGTGFTQKFATELRARLEAIACNSSPFDPPPAGPLARRAHWVAPKLVCEVQFTEWTGDGSIRHPSFQGLRADKRPEEVVRESPRP